MLTPVQFQGLKFPKSSLPPDVIITQEDNGVIRLSGIGGLSCPVEQSRDSYIIQSNLLPEKMLKGFLVAGGIPEAQIKSTSVATNPIAGVLGKLFSKIRQSLPG